MATTVCVIEAPGKITTFRDLLSQVIDGDLKVIATKGRLFDMPEQRPSFDHIPSAKDLIPLNPEIIDSLSKLFAEADQVLLMTDNDIEGEVIAYQAQSLIPPGKESRRVRFNLISEKSLKQAIDQASDVDTGMVSSGIAKRLYDYTIGKSVSPEHLAHEYGVAIGSVISPLLDHMQRNPVPIGYVQKTIVDDHGSPWLMRIPFFPGESDEMEMVSEYLSGVSEASVHAYEDVTLEDSASPMTGPIAMKNLALATGTTVNEVEQSLQRLYQKGELSYPRTDSYYLSEDTANQLKALADHFGVDGFDAKHLAEKSRKLHSKGGQRKSQDAHEALHVVSPMIPFYSPMTDLHLDDQIKVLVARELMRAGQKDRELRTKKGRIKDSVQNQSVINYLSKYRDRIEIEQSETYRKGLKNKQYIDPVGKPLGVSIGNQVNKTTRVIKYGNDIRVLMALEDIGIGRPSTVAHHSNSIAKRYLSNDGFVNKRGHMVVMTTRQLVPNLLKKEPKEVVDFLINNIENKQLDYEARAKKALSVIGINPERRDNVGADQSHELPYGFNN